jgi:hypothetical protein
MEVGFLKEARLLGRVLKLFPTHDRLVLRRANTIRPYRKIWIVGANGIRPVRQSQGFKTRSRKRLDSSPPVPLL